MLPGVNVSKCYPLRITHRTAQVIAERFYYEDKQGQETKLNEERMAVQNSTIHPLPAPN